MRHVLVQRLVLLPKYLKMFRRTTEVFADDMSIVIQLVLNIVSPACFANALTVREPITEAQTNTEHHDTGTDENDRTH